MVLVRKEIATSVTGVLLGCLERLLFLVVDWPYSSAHSLTIQYISLAECLLLWFKNRPNLKI